MVGLREKNGNGNVIMLERMDYQVTGGYNIWNRIAVGWGSKIESSGARKR